MNKKWVKSFKTMNIEDGYTRREEITSVSKKLRQSAVIQSVPPIC